MNKYTNKTLFRLIPIKETVLKVFQSRIICDFSLCVWCCINIKGIIHPRILPSSAKHKCYFEEGGKPNSYWYTVFPTVKVNVDQQLFCYPHSSKYLLTDVNV